MLVINRALNDDLLDNELRREIVAAAKTYDFARLEVPSTRVDADVDNRAKCFHAWLSSRGPGLGGFPFLEDYPEMQRCARDFLEAPAKYLPLFIFMDLLLCCTTLLVISSAMAYAIFSRETRKVRHVLTTVTYPRTLSLQNKSYSSLPLRNESHDLPIQCTFFFILRLPSSLPEQFTPRISSPGFPSGLKKDTDSLSTFIPVCVKY